MGCGPLGPDAVLLGRCDEMNADIAGAANQLLRDGALNPLGQPRLLGLADHDVRDVAGLRITHDLVGRLASRKGGGLSTELLGEAQGVGDPVALLLGEPQGTGRFDVECHPRRAKAIRHAPGVADQRCAAGVVVDAHRDALAGGPGSGDGVRLHVMKELLVDALRRPP